MGTELHKTKIVVAMSGGVDSSVTAALLKNKGYNITGITMRIWDGEVGSEEGQHHGCYGPGEEEDIEDARRVAAALGIDYFVFDLRREYKNVVLDYFRNEYLAGRTPNPCVVCNHHIKFDALLRKTLEGGIEFDYVATGHYARLEHDESSNRNLLKKAKDLRKDQSYFLSFLSQEQLAHSLFPLGDYTKEEVREMAAAFGLSVVDKRESQDFISGDYSDLVGTAQSGPIIDTDGNVMGEHRGITLFTIGQRKGLGISTKEPLYVTDIDPENNTVVVGSKMEIYRHELIASGLNWIAIDGLEQPMTITAKIRHSHKGARAIMTPLSEDKVHLTFEEPQMAITPGQAVVFYDGDAVVGAGTIERTKER